jgi:hypothetical protein
MAKHDCYYYKILDGGMATPTPEDCILESRIKVTEKGIYEDVKNYFENDYKYTILVDIIQIGDTVYLNTSKENWNRKIYIMKYFKYHDGLSDQKICKVI